MEHSVKMEHFDPNEASGLGLANSPASNSRFEVGGPQNVLWEAKLEHSVKMEHFDPNEASGPGLVNSPASNSRFEVGGPQNIV